jgi:hypothetical protein
MICRLPKSSRLFGFRRTLFVFAHIISSIIHQSKLQKDIWYKKTHLSAPEDRQIPF